MRFSGGCGNDVRTNTLPRSHCQSIAFLILLLAPHLCLAQPPGVLLTPHHVVVNDVTRGGYVDSNGEFVVAPIFQTVTPFSEGVAAVSIDNRWGFINPLGKFLIDPKFDLAGPFTDGLAPVRVDEKYGFIDHQGVLRISPTFDWAGGFSDGLAPFRYGQQYGFIGVNGELVIKPQFQSVRPYSEGFAAVRIAGGFGYINRSGRFLIDPEFKAAGNFSEGCAWVQTDDEKIRFITRSGELAFDKTFERAFSFTNGFAAVRRDGRFGLIDHRGDFVFDPIASSVNTRKNEFHLSNGKTIFDSAVSLGPDGSKQSVYSMRARNVKWIEAVRLVSKPSGARVYRVESWKRDLADNVRDLMTPENSVVEGDKTEVEAWLHAGYKWTIIFEREKEVREKVCVPGVNKSVSVSFE